MFFQIEHYCCFLFCFHDEIIYLTSFTGLSRPKKEVFLQGNLVAVQFLLEKLGLFAQAQWMCIHACV